MTIKNKNQTSLMKWNSLTLKQTIFMAENIVNDEFPSTPEFGELLSLPSYKKD